MGTVKNKVILKKFLFLTVPMESTFLTFFASSKSAKNVEIPPFSGHCKKIHILN
nr:MAG TPA: hypothetical protein [Caudoviricetes sp.]